ncbi:hypothetical protein HanHA300_Chr00c0821g0815351 [Helianthus annuus]|nr:hypothetical protein HanHA89_Chr14g0595081 [Helianthus annuus]KAJ0620600.1 hypothetical protein HanHA300_Chr00c0821g0815351 [Helianthus annuus]KAJ0658337.1 hypothetical protein HanLR1_Chr14g0556591 [Helianthus annuus]
MCRNVCKHEVELNIYKRIGIECTRTWILICMSISDTNYVVFENGIKVQI